MGSLLVMPRQSAGRRRVTNKLLKQSRFESRREETRSSPAGAEAPRSDSVKKLLASQPDVKTPPSQRKKNTQISPSEEKKVAQISPAEEKKLPSQINIPQQANADKVTPPVTIPKTTRKVSPSNVSPSNVSPSNASPSNVSPTGRSTSTDPTLKKSGSNSPTLTGANVTPPTTPDSAKLTPPDATLLPQLGSHLDKDNSANEESHNGTSTTGDSEADGNQLPELPELETFSMSKARIVEGAPTVENISENKPPANWKSAAPETNQKTEEETSWRDRAAKILADDEDEISPVATRRVAHPSRDKEDSDSRSSGAGGWRSRINYDAGTTKPVRNEEKPPSLKERMDALKAGLDSQEDETPSYRKKYTGSSSGSYTAPPSSYSSSNYTPSYSSSSSPSYSSGSRYGGSTGRYSSSRY